MSRILCFFFGLLFLSSAFALLHPFDGTALDSTNFIFVEELGDNVLMPSIGNGYVSSFIYSNTVYVGGLFNGFLNIAPSHRAVIPSSFNYNLKLESNQTQPLNSRNEGCLFDIANGIFSQFTGIYNNEETRITSIEMRWYAHRKYRSLIVCEVLVNNTQNSDSFNFEVYNDLEAFTSSDISFSRVSDQNMDYTLYNGSIIQPEQINGLQVTVSVCTDNIDSNGITLSVSSGSLESFRFVTTYQTNIPGDSNNPSSSALSLWQEYKNYNDSLYDEHIAAWSAIWDNCGLEINGDSNALRLQQVTNTSLYWILSSVREDWPWSLSPGSLASSGYNGHSFWDTETWMYPTIMMLDTGIGKSILQYRYNHLEGAKEFAKRFIPQYNGAMFPWEDAFSGLNVCPIGVDTCKNEQHITGDISFALRQYWANTHDKKWLADSIDIINSMCEFWESRVLQNNTMYVIDNVVPPDEYAVGVNNSVYTNVVAKMTFELQEIAGNTLGINIPQKWTDIQENLKIPFDTNRQIHLEYDGYTDEEIKQADVILLGFPLMFNMTKSIRENDLTFYSSVTDPNGPAMTWAMTAIGYIELQDYDTADSYFTEGYANAQEPFQVWTETPTGGTVNFITGCGGFLQSILFGYPNLRLHDDYISIDSPSLPMNSTSITLRKMDYRGSQLNIQYDSENITFTLMEQGNEPIFCVQTSSMKYLRPSLSEVLIESLDNPIQLQLNIPISFPVNNQSVLFVPASN